MSTSFVCQTKVHAHFSKFFLRCIPQGFEESGRELGRTSEENHHQYSGDASPHEQHQPCRQHLTHMYRHAHAYTHTLSTRKHTPRMDLRRTDFVGPRVAEHFPTDTGQIFVCLWWGCSAGTFDRLARGEGGTREGCKKRCGLKPRLSILTTSGGCEHLEASPCTVWLPWEEPALSPQPVSGDLNSVCPHRDDSADFSGNTITSSLTFLRQDGVKQRDQNEALSCPRRRSTLDLVFETFNVSRIVQKVLINILLPSIFQTVIIHVRVFAEWRATFWKCTTVLRTVWGWGNEALRLLSAECKSTYPEFFGAQYEPSVRRVVECGIGTLFSFLSPASEQKTRSVVISAEILTRLPTLSMLCTPECFLVERLFTGSLRVGSHSHIMLSGHSRSFALAGKCEILLEPLKL